ncbi:MAG TPA: hypothetical protein VIC33_05795 [Vicinamibacterales bacterium]|jgi:hypothetical protein
MAATAFFYANDNTRYFDPYTASSPALQHLGELVLQPGRYLVWAKASVIAIPAPQYPPPNPNITWVGGILSLSLAGVQDAASVPLRPEQGENVEVASLMVAAEITGVLPAQLRFQTSLFQQGPSVAVNCIRITALQVDTLSVTAEPLPIPEGQIRRR